MQPTYKDNNKLVFRTPNVATSPQQFKVSFVMDGVTSVWSSSSSVLRFFNVTANPEINKFDKGMKEIKGEILKLEVRLIVYSVLDV